MMKILKQIFCAHRWQFKTRLFSVSSQITALRQRCPKCELERTIYG